MSQNRNLAKLSDWFFLDGTETSVRGNFTRFLENHDPSEATMKALLNNSIAMFAEAESKAALTTGGAINLEAGLVSVATDVEAKANTEGLKADRTVVPTSKHLPTVIDNSQTIGSLTDILVQVAITAVSTRNEFQVELKQAFIDYLALHLLPEFVVGDALKTIQINAGGTAYELTAFPSTGEANTMSNNGAGAQVFKTKTGIDFELRTLDNSDSYIDITQGTDTITFDLNLLDLTAYLQLNLVFATNAANLGTGSYGLFSALNGSILEFKELLQNTGIILTSTSTGIGIGLDIAYVNNLIASGGGGGLGPAETAYLFRATKIAIQLLTSDIGAGFLQNTILFEDDENSPNYDNGGVWGISKFVHANTSSALLRFILTGLEIENLSAGALNANIAIVKESNPMVEIGDVPLTVLETDKNTSISSADITSNLATYNTTAAHGYTTGQYVDVTGTGGGAPALTGTFKITVTSTTQFTATIVAVDQSTSTGTMSPNGYIFDLNLDQDKCYYVSLEDDGTSASTVAIALTLIGTDILEDASGITEPINITPSEWDGRLIKFIPNTINLPSQELLLNATGFGVGEFFSGTLTVFDSGLQILAETGMNVIAIGTETIDISTSLSGIEPLTERVKVIIESDDALAGDFRVNALGVFHDED